MNKKTIVTAGIFLGAMIAIILILVLVEGVATNEQTPELSNGGDTYLTLDGVEITNDQLWDTMMNIDGVDYILDYTLEYLLADEINAVTQEEIDEELQLLTYLTDDAETIAKIQEDEDIHQDYLDAFRQNVTVLGYNPDDADSLAEFISLSIAKRNYTEALYIDATMYLDDAETEENPMYTSEDDVQDFYEDNTYGDVCSLDIRFSSSTELNSILADFNLVPNYNNGLGEYIGQTPYSDLLQSDFDENNTIQLDADGVWGYFVDIYNVMNPNGTQLPSNVSQEDYCANYTDLAVKNYEDMTYGGSTGYPEFDLATYLFEALDLETGVSPFTYTTSKTFGDYTYLNFKISADTVTEWDDLSAAEQTEYREEYIREEVVTDTIITTTMDNLLVENGFEIFEPSMKLKYSFTYNVEFDNNGSSTLVAKVDDKDITVDEFFDYMAGRIGTFYSIEVVKQQVFLYGDTYTELFGESHDYFSASNDKLKGFVEQLDEMKALFGSNYYGQYGYGSEDMTWEEFIYLAFGLADETALLENMYILPAIQTDYMFGTIDYADTVAFMQDQADSYYSLNVNHILIYLDLDFDFTPDDFVEYRDSLEGQKATDFQALLVSFENLIKSKVIDGEDTLAEIVTAYNEASINDMTSEWYTYKQAGFFMKTEELGEINQVSGLQLDEAFNDSLKRMYDDYVVDPTEDVINDDRVTISQFGVHYITATKGTDFEQYTAGDDVIPTEEQLDLYLEIQYATAMDENSTATFDDEDVKTAVEYYFSTLYTAYTSSTAFGAAVGQYTIDNGGEFATDNTATLAELQILIDTLNEVNYPELFGVQED